MGRKSTREDKTPYQTAREAMDLSREKAAEGLGFVSEDRIEKIESGRSAAHPDEILAMSEFYREPGLCNYYCSHECPIGQKYVPEVPSKELSQIVLELLASLNALNRDKERLVEITVDGKITENERAEFQSIDDQLRKIQLAVDSMHLWVQRTLAAQE